MHIFANQLKTICHTTLDGQPVADCWEANEEGGYVVVHVRGDDGQILIDREKNETVKATRCGAVKITDTGIPRA